MLLGFESTKSRLYESFQKHKLHHAILICGKKGIGKASFAKEFVGEILDTKNSSHPDLLLVEKEEEKKEITIDRVRKIFDFANQTSAISAQKFIIIDAACELNKSASNALLKILEEPRAENFLILIAHNSSRVLPTIRSRCLSIKIPDFSYADFSKILYQKNRTLSEQEIKFLSKICDNSPAQALTMGADLTLLYQDFLNSLKNKKPTAEILKKISEKNFSFTNFEKIFEFFASRLSKFPQEQNENFFFNEEEIFSSIWQIFSAEKIFKTIDEALILLRKTNSLYLDKKLTTINIFNKFLAAN